MRVVHIITAAAFVSTACVPASAELRVIQTCEAQARACDVAIANAPDGPTSIAIAAGCYRQWEACMMPPYTHQRRLGLPGPMITPGRGWHWPTAPRRDFFPAPRMSGLPLATMRHFR